METSQYELVLIEDGLPSVILPVGAAVLALGRGPGNQLVSPDPEVSWRHAEVWLDGGHLFIRDLASRNGTWVNGSRLSVGARTLAHLDRIRIGPNTEFEIRHHGDSLDIPPLELEQIGSGHRLALTGETFRIGTQPDDDLRLSDAGSSRAVVTLSAEEGLLVDDGTGLRPLALGESFRVGSRQFRVLRADLQRAPTVGVGVTGGAPHDGRYALTARFLPNGEPTIELRDPANNSTWRCDGGNRALLVYLLGRQIQRDREAGRAGADEGWMADDEVLTGIWGRKGDANKLYVLLHRVRNELTTAGLDARCLQKRPGMTRVGADTIGLQARQAPPKP